MQTSRKQPETKFKEQVLKDLKTIPGIWFFKTQEVGRRGIPDILICAGGILIALELKIETGRVDRLQQHVLGKIKAAGGVAMAVKPSEWPMMKCAIKQFTEQRAGNRQGWYSAFVRNG